jgi:flagellar motility protein MotE (MotC chaperone)
VGLKKILMLAGIGLAFFLVSLMLGWKIHVPAAVAASEPNQTESGVSPRGYINPISDKLAMDAKSTIQSLSEKQLESMIFELREKIRDNKKKEQELTSQEERLKAASEEIKADLEKLSGLRTELAGTVSQIKQERDALGKDVVTVTSAEMTKLKQIASIHDKMDPASGSALLLSMVMNKRVDDAVQILNYMQERNAAKVLGEIVSKDPKVATLLCERLKKLREEKQP